MKPRWEKLSLEELKASALWYNRQEAGLGEAFIDEVEIALQKVSEHPELPPLYEAGCRKFHTTRQKISGQ